MAASKKTIITNIQVFSGGAFSQPQTVTLEEGLIGSIVQASGAIPASNAEVIHGEGKYLVPGYVDCHVHIRFKEELFAHARHGVTTVMDMGCWPPSLVNSFRNLAGYPAYLAAGPVALTPRGMGGQRNIGLPKEAFVDTEEDAVQFVKNRVAEKTDFVKIVCEDETRTYVAHKLAAEAKAVGKISVAHAPNALTYQMAYDAKVDVITHAPVDKVVSEELCQDIAKAGQICVPTLVMMKGIIDMLSKPSMILKVTISAMTRMWSQGMSIRAILGTIYQRASTGMDLQRSIDTVRKMHQAGVPVLTGTDANHPPQSGGPTRIEHGSSFQAELELLAQAGLSPLEILKAATENPADYLRLPDRGRIEVGKRADLVLLGSDPLINLEGFSHVEEVWCAGVRVER